MSKARFEAALFEGHKGVTAVIVPFDPDEVWGLKLGLKPVKLASRRDGWLVTGTVNGTRFDGYIGFRWGRFFIIVEPALRSTAKLFVGDTLSVVVEPTYTEGVREGAQAVGGDHGPEESGGRDRVATVAIPKEARVTDEPVPPDAQGGLRPARRRDRAASISAGWTLRLLEGWVFLAVFSGASLAITIYVAKKDRRPKRSGARSSSGASRARVPLGDRRSGS
jgi:hypothetical protein